MRRHHITALAVTFLVGLPPPQGIAEDVCVGASTSGTDVPNHYARPCQPTSLPVTCRDLSVSHDSRARVWVEVCFPRVVAEDPTGSLPAAVRGTPP